MMQVRILPCAHKVMENIVVAFASISSTEEHPGKSVA